MKNGIEQHIAWNLPGKSDKGNEYSNKFIDVIKNDSKNENGFFL